MKKILRKIDFLIVTVCGTMFLSAIVINFANVFGRYALGIPVYWAEEVVTLLMTFSVFLLLFNLSVNGAHLKVDMLNLMLPRMARRILEIAVLLISSVFSLFLAYKTKEIVFMMARFSQTTNVSGFPMWVVYAVVFLGFLFTALGSLIKIWLLVSKSSENSVN